MFQFHADFDSKVEVAAGLFVAIDFQRGSVCGGAYSERLFLWRSIFRVVLFVAINIQSGSVCGD